MHWLSLASLPRSLAAGITAVVMERVAYRPLRKRGVSRLAYLITAIGVSLTLSNLFLLLDGKKHLGLPVAWPAVGGPAGVTYPTTIQHTVCRDICRDRSGDGERLWTMLSRTFMSHGRA